MSKGEVRIPDDWEYGELPEALKEFARDNMNALLAQIVSEAELNIDLTESGGIEWRLYWEGLQEDLITGEIDFRDLFNDYDEYALWGDDGSGENGAARLRALIEVLSSFLPENRAEEAAE